MFAMNVDRVEKGRINTMLNKRIKRFFAVSIVSVLIVCFAVFASVIFYMQRQTETSVEDISEIYMGEVDYAAAPEPDKRDYPAYPAWGACLWGRNA